MKNDTSSVALGAKRRAILQRWITHEFYTSALVLGLDIGIQGIGVWLRKGPECLFRRTFLVSLPEAAPLLQRRQLRAARNARRSRKRRERLLRAWIVRYGLLTEDRVAALWRDPRVFERAYEHRYRAITEGKSLASPEALVVCIRHLIKHRGYDYHLLFQEATSFPWGDELVMRDIIKWSAKGTLPEEYGNDLKWNVRESGALTEDQIIDAERMIEDAIQRYKADPIRTMLQRHLKEKNHNNLREPARGENYPRELVKEHLRRICQRHAAFFPDGQFDQAMMELIGPLENGVEKYGMTPESIIDYHRRTPEEARRLWEKKEGSCDLAPSLIAAGKLPLKDYKRSSAGDSAVRQWKVLLFLAERNVELATKVRRNVSAEIIQVAMEFVKEDAASWASKTTRAKAPNFRKQIVSELGALMKNSESKLNKSFFDQLKDLLAPRAPKMTGKANIASETAAVLIQLATADGQTFAPAIIRENLADYYQWRLSVQSGKGSYPQVDVLLGHSGHYKNGQTKDGPRRTNSPPQEHGILRRLFAGQLRLDTGETVNLTSVLDGKSVPDYVVVETVRDMPKNRKQRKEIEKEQGERRSAKSEITERYNLNFRELTDAQTRRVLLFHQQANKDKEGICPYTGKSLGRDPLSPQLEVDHIFPESRGGLAIMENLVLTERTTNAEKGNRTPVEWLGTNEAAQRIRSMEWNPRKKEVFLWTESECPDWQNMTRTAQLARELRSRVIEWLGIETAFPQIKEEAQRSRAVQAAIRTRIGAPSGALTASCRQAWRGTMPDEYFRTVDLPGQTIQVKDRRNYRHHMWDAGVISNIPPGDGLNSVLNGGIFEPMRDVQGMPMMCPLLELAPDLDAINKQDPVGCYVSQLRQKNSKKARTSMQPLSLPDEDGQLWQRVTISKKITKDGVVDTVKPDRLLDALRKAGITSDRISDSKVEQWEASPQPVEKEPLRLKDKTPVHGLRLPIKQKPAELGRHPHIKTTLSPLPGLAYQSEKGHTRGELIGLKTATDVYDRSEIWRGPAQTKQGQLSLDEAGETEWKYATCLIPTARNLQAAKRMRGYPVVIPKPEGMTERVGVLRKGDLLLAEFGPCSDGKLKLCDPGQRPYASLWMRVISLLSSRQIEMGLAEFEDFSATPLKNSIIASPLWQPSSPSILVRLLEATHRARNGT